jgi:HD-like signal output (HDOD) protein
LSAGDVEARSDPALPPKLPRLDPAEIARAVEKLPALPPSATRLLAVLGSGDWHADQVTSVIALDPILTGRTLSLANSAAYAHQGSITSVRQAIARLGVGTITSIAVAVAVHSLLRDPLHAYGASAGLLWRHSVAASVAVEGISAVFRWMPPAESATTALLHDIGKLLLARKLTPTAAKFIERAAEEGKRNTARAESDLLGSSHAEIGACIAEAWHLPSTIVQGIRHHHALHLASSEEELAVCRAVTIGDAIARRIAPGLGEVEERWSIERDAEAAHVPAEGMEALADSTAERLAEVLKLYES